MTVRTKEEEHVATSLNTCAGYPSWTTDKVKRDTAEKSRKDKTEIGSDQSVKHKGLIVVPYVKGLSEAHPRILKSHGIATANRPHRTLRNILAHPKDNVKDEEKTELIYRIQELPQFLRWENRQEARPKDEGAPKRSALFHSRHTHARASRARESSVTHKSAITDHAVEQNHVIDWDSAEVVAREAHRQTRWIKEALWIRETNHGRRHA